MTVEEALVIVDTVLYPKHLSDLQELVFRGVWERQTYEQIAISYSYDTDYIKQVGSQLWQELSRVLGEKVTKSNCHSVLRRKASPPQKLATLLDISEPQISKQWREPMNEKEEDRQQPLQISDFDFLEFPSGPVPIDSKFYIDRPPIEERTYTQIAKPGSLIRIKAPRQMGKTSLLHRIMAHARQAGLRTVVLSLQRADTSIFTSLDKFLRWLCANVSRQLNLEPRLDEYWDEDIGSKVSCTLYFQEFLLRTIDAPVVLALDEVNRIFEYADISSDFLPLLRSWYEEASELDVWQKLRLVVVHATEAYIPLDINQSPFNVGLPIKLPELSLEQIQDLAMRHRLDWIDKVGVQNLAPLLAMVGGHPYLVRLAFYHLGRQELTLEQLLQTSPTVAGIYSDHLRRLLANLQQHSKLAGALKRVVLSSDPVQLEAIAAYKLESMGLVKLEENQAIPSCELYRLYFREQLN
ncbi:MAG: AAA-like domain-containing protein [Rhizonema sp. PD38]|nr:AAA-like domain-containing protein [Rhizonema sp. PD38]